MLKLKCSKLKHPLLIRVKRNKTWLNYEVIYESPAQPTTSFKARINEPVAHKVFAFLLEHKIGYDASVVGPAVMTLREQFVAGDYEPEDGYDSILTIERGK